MFSKISELPILFCDDYFVVVAKPSGLLVHATKIDAHETQFALQILRDQIGAKVFSVHRLDKATSGALIFATSSEAAKLLGDEFSAGRVTKSYLALIRGSFSEIETRIDYPLKEILDRKTDRLAQKDKPAKTALTIFRKISGCEIDEKVDRYPTARYSLIEATPLTGRKHQIRRHLKHLSHPIVGDVNYGSGAHNKFFRERFGCHRLMLASTQIKFMHPFTQKEIVVDAPLELSFQKTLTQIGLLT